MSGFNLKQLFKNQNKQVNNKKNGAFLWDMQGRKFISVHSFSLFILKSDSKGMQATLDFFSLFGPHVPFLCFKMLEGAETK